MQNIVYTPDKDLYGVKEYIASPIEILENGKGDCDDFATIYIYLLNYYFGIEAEAVWVITVSGNNHVLVDTPIHDYLVSPQVYNFNSTGYEIVKYYTYDQWMRMATNNNSRGERE